MYYPESKKHYFDMQQGTDNLNTLTNIVYVLTDVLETNLMDMQKHSRSKVAPCVTM